MAIGDATDERPPSGASADEQPPPDAQAEDRPTANPEDDPRAEYDYESGAVDRPGLVSDLEKLIEGDVRFDSYSRQLYATDASIYEATPIGVVFPTSTADVAAVMNYCADRKIPVLPRGGGTSLAGQAVNEAVVLDFARYMGEIVDVDPDERLVRAQPGVVLAELNRELGEHDLKFAPDPAWGDKSVLGGAIGNNSTGSHSLVYGKTDAYVESAQVVLADGTVTEFGEVSLDELTERADTDGDLESRIYAAVDRLVREEDEAIEDAFPRLKRNVSGYNLDRLIEDARSGSVNLARLLAGSEGTLAIVTEATVSLEPVPETKGMALLSYPDLGSAMTDVAPVVEHGPAAVEVLDEVLIGLARRTEEFTDLVEMLPAGTNAVLLVEFYAESDVEAREKVANLLTDRVPDAETSIDPTPERTTTDAGREAIASLEAHDAEERARFWKLRKSGLPILLSRTSDEKHVAFIEDTAIPPENLPEYVADVQTVLEEHGTFASYYAHAGPGCLHIRPLVNTKTEAGVETMRSIADAVTDLVIEYGGSVSGEHGDGRARSEWNRKLYGERVFSLFVELKGTFDPDGLLNPGQVCGDVSMTENLRFGSEYSFEAGFEPSLRWENDNGFQGMVELCHGCGGCRGGQSTTGGVMCPTYRAASEESTSTRGRANALRQAMSGDLPDDPFTEEFATEIMDLCIGCKGCARDCPSEVDMAKLKAEIEHEYHRRNGASLRSRLFADIDSLSALASALAPVSNWLPKLPGTRTVMEKTVGIAAERTLPEFHRETLTDWFAAREDALSEDEAIRRVLLFPDTYTNYNHPEAGKAAVEVLEAANVHVRIPEDVTASGRPAHSKGFLEKSRARASVNVDALAPLVREGWDVVVVEPSDAVMLQQDYLDLLAGNDVEQVAANTYGVLEYLDRFELDRELAFDAPDESLVYHGHCHQKATKRETHAATVLARAGYDVDALDSGCCGMAGSFGYEAEHYSMSMAIASVLFQQVAESDGEVVVAPGASCRGQLAEYVGEDPPHPIEKVAEALE